MNLGAIFNFFNLEKGHLFQFFKFYFQRINQPPGSPVQSRTNRPHIIRLNRENQEPEKTPGFSRSVFLVEPENRVPIPDRPPIEISIKMQPYQALNRKLWTN